MSEKRILLADADSDALEEFRRILSQQWTVATVTGGEAAIDEMKKLPCDVVVADLDLPEIDGAKLLNRIRKEYPKTILFILATDADKERVMKNVLGAHQFLTKPCDPATLKNAIERAMALDVWVASSKMRELVARVRTFPTVPSLYFEILSALRSPNATTEQIGAIISKDMAMTTKLMQVLNSAYFGLSRKITDPVEAVGILGFDAVKSMVMTLKLLSQYDKVKPVYFSIDRLWRHSTQVGRTAKQLTLLYTNDRAMGETSFTAGLMHDLGKIVLAANFDEQYRGVQSLAIKQQLPLWEVEKEIFGANHGEIGAYLLGLWGMPLDLLEAAALHHNPAQNLTKGFTPLTAVHVANALEYEANPEKEGISAKVDEAYLAELGVLDRLDSWRNAFYKREGKPEPKARAGESSAAKASAPKPVTMAVPTALKPAAPAPKLPAPAVKQAPGSGLKKKQLAFAGVGVCALFLVIWGMSAMFSHQTEKGLAGPAATQASTETPLIVHARSPETPVVTPDASTTQSNAPASEPTPVVAVKAPPKEPSFSDLKLQGIFYSSSKPSAIISGKMVHANDRVGGALVVEINRSTVTLDYQNQRKTLVLK